MQTLPVRDRMISAVTAACCFFISAIALFVVWNAVDCARQNLIDTDGDCPTALNWHYFLLNPFILISVFFLITLVTLAKQKHHAVARRILAWWAILFVLFTGCMVIIEFL